MIIVRSPLRITLGGGGTDLPSYYQEHDGFVVSASINKYVYITLGRTFTDDLCLKYSQTERVKHLDDIKHPLFRGALRLMGINPTGLEITCVADVPARTGLGSSGSFTTALLKALHVYMNIPIMAGDLAELACKIEIDILHRPVGKQDQYTAAYGGQNCFWFMRGSEVMVWPLMVDDDIRCPLQDNLLLFFTGVTRNAADTLQEQVSKCIDQDEEMLANLHYARRTGHYAKCVIEDGHLEQYAEVLNAQWESKKKRSCNMSSGQIDRWYTLGMDNGALGGKLVGAGGGGFLLFYARDKEKLRHAMRQAGLPELRFLFEGEGTKVIQL